MTVRELILDLWDLSGHASDMYPFQSDTQDTASIDLTAEGTQYFLRLASQGQIALANWKKKDQRMIRFRDFYVSTNIQLGVDPDVSFDVTRTSFSNFTIDPTQTGWVMDIETFKNSVLVYGASKYKVMMAVEISPTLWNFLVLPDPTVDTDDDGEVLPYPYVMEEVIFAINEFDVSTSAVVPSNQYEIVLPERVYTVLRIDDYNTSEEVKRSNNKEDLASKGEANNTGVPAWFLNLGSKIIFDTALEEKRWYKFEVFQQPADITTLDQILAIPPSFHQALVFWAMWKISLRERQEIMSANFRRLLDNELLSTRDEGDNEFERTKTYGLKIRRD